MKEVVDRLRDELAQERALGLAAREAARIFTQPRRYATPEQYLKALTGAMRRQSLIAGLTPPDDIPSAFTLTPATELAARRGLANIKRLKQTAGNWGAT